jgi:hypothetical protein
MSEERKADLEAALAELEYEVWLALKQDALTYGQAWTKIVRDGDKIVVTRLTIDEVLEKADADRIA